MAQNKSTTASRAISKSQVIKQLGNEMTRIMANKAQSKVNISANSKSRSPSMGAFSGVSQVTAAPVSIGNTIRSVGLSITRTKDGVVAVGRDYVQTVGGTTNSFTSWTLQAGMALSPMALNASALRGYFQSHQSYKFHKVVAHFITSSPTSTSGDVMIMYHANHGGPKVDHTSNNFLAYALSTENTVLGPQWTNHSVEIVPKDVWLSTDVLNSEDVEHQADGEILVYTKNSTNAAIADAPGYLLLDYQVEFKFLMTNPRIASIPSSVFKWFPTGLFINMNIAAGDPIRMDVATASTYNAVTGVVPTNAVVGTIFQVVLDFQSASYGVITSANLPTLLAINQARNAAGAVTGSMVYAIGTGTTLYAVYRGTTLFDLYPSYPAVFAGNALVATAGFGVGSFVNAVSIMCAVGSVNSTFLQANLG